MGLCYYYTPFSLVVVIGRGPTQRGGRLALTVMAHHEELAMSWEVFGPLPVEILVFSSPTGYKLTCSGVFGLELENISVNSFKSVGNFPQVLNFCTGHLSNSTGSSVTSGWFSPFIGAQKDEHCCHVNCCCRDSPNSSCWDSIS